MKTHVSICLLFVLSSVASTLSSNANADDLKSVKARTLELSVPDDWKQVKTTSNMRAAQFQIPNDKGDDSDLVVFYFGGPTGGVKANVERWVGQFAEDDRKVEMSQGKCKAGSYIIVDAIGTWNKPDGPPFARKTIKTPGSRVINVIVVEEDDAKKDYYFMKLSGTKEHVATLAESLRESIGADKKSEKEFELKDAEN